MKTCLCILLSLMASLDTEAQQTCRGDIPASTPFVDFTDHADGTVTHERTGLMWKQCLEGQSEVGCVAGSPTSFTWQQALQYANTHTFAGHNDWRLPNIKELSSIVEERCYSPAINLEVFPADPGSDVWSGSPDIYSYNAWYVYFYDGNDGSYYRNGSLWVRLVRGGQ